MIAKSFITTLTSVLSVSLVVTAFAPSALASDGPFRVRTSRPEYAREEVARPITIQKEWLELGLSYQYRAVSQYTDKNGKVQDADYDYRMSWLALDARYGFTKNMTIFMSIPVSVYSERSEGNSSDGTVTESGLGDVRFGFQWQAFQRASASSLTSVALQVDMKQPSGSESPGAPGDRHLLLGTGTTNTGLKVFAKQRIGPVAAVANLGYTHKFSAVTMWVRDTEGPAGLNGRFKPGDELTAGLHAIVQPIRFLAVDVGADYVNRAESSVGASSNGINPAANLETIPDSDFEAVNASGRLIVQASTNWDFIGGVSTPVMSRNSGVFFPLEDLSQSYGTTFTGAVMFRW